MDIQNTYNPAAFFEEIQNITNEIEGIFKDYNFHIEKKTCYNLYLRPCFMKYRLNLQ